jgi:hypothetical protein
MGVLDNVLGSAVPGGNLAKPLMIGLAALLAAHVTRGSEVCSEGLGKLRRLSRPHPRPSQRHLVSRRKVLSAGLAACCSGFSKTGMATLSTHGSGQDRTNRSSRTNFIKHSAPKQSAISLA